MIERTLWYETDHGREELQQEELRGRTEPLVILGEAGMGKTHLLEWLAESPNFAWCTANQLINRPDASDLLGDCQALVIDALDEVPAQKEGAATGSVLRKLGELGYPQFVVSCRVADWRSATGLKSIREQYPKAPLELHLKPFDEADAHRFLSSTLGAEVATTAIDHFNARGLDELLGNPWTLVLIARIAATGDLPHSRAELFELGIEQLRKEHNEARATDQYGAEALSNTSLSRSSHWCASYSLFLKLLPMSAVGSAVMLELFPPYGNLGVDHT